MDAHEHDERQRLEQELLELHFGCHPDPEALTARLQREPELRALQQRALATAALLQEAAQPATAQLQLPRPLALPWWHRPWRRVAAVAAAAGLAVAALGARYGVLHWREGRVRGQ